MDERLARFRLQHGLDALKERRPAFELRERYLRGEQKLPFAPVGVDAEYVDLQKQALANYFAIAVNAPVQRLRADGIRTGMGDQTDRDLWANAWQANKMDTRQTLIYRSQMLHSRGIASVWPNADEPSRPIVRPESVDLVHVEMDPDDPFSPLWAVKAFTTSTVPDELLPGFVQPRRMEALEVAIVYDDKEFLRFEKRRGDGDWRVVKEGPHPMRRPPFALYDYRSDAQGKPWSTMDALIPQQDAINTIRFNTLLAMQFSAFRQRVVTGFDPRAVDEQGRFLYQKDANGEPVLDPKTGAPIPILNSPGKAGVDRILAFPGGDTHVFDLPESNLANYVEVLQSFLVQFFSTGQIPPQYLLSQMANLSGDALAGAESTLSSLVQELQLSAGEGHESTLELAWFAAGNEKPFAPSTETQWADAEARSFAQIVDAIGKLIAGGFPKRDAWAMIPGATLQKLELWLQHAQDEAQDSLLALATRTFVDVTPGAQQGAAEPAGEPPVEPAAIEGA
jgi:Phage portal protein, SPP1 Gp6-like